MWHIIEVSDITQRKKEVKILGLEDQHLRQCIGIPDRKLKEHDYERVTMSRKLEIEDVGCCFERT